MIFDKFTTPRLAAQRLREEDFADLLALHQDPRVMAWLSASGDVLDEAKTRESLDRQLDHWRRHGFGTWMFRTKSDNRFVGRALLRKRTIDGREELELGYALGSAWWGHGLATEMSKALLGLAFEVLGNEEVVTFTLPHNRASRRVMEKLGFTFERDFVHADLPHVLYRLTKAAWNTPSPPVAEASSFQCLLSCDQVGEIDRRAAADYGLATLTLMETAGHGSAQTLLSLGIRGPVVVCCGKGNNGGDGLVMARHLHVAEIDVKVLLFAAPSELSADAAVNWKIVERAEIPAQVLTTLDEAGLVAELTRAEWAVDALFGTGLTGPVRPPLDRVIGAVNAGPARVFAVDIPSGLDGDTGEPLGVAIRAHHTVTFVAPKKGFANPAAAAWVGKVHVVDIGVPLQLVNDILKAG